MSWYIIVSAVAVGVSSLARCAPELVRSCGRDVENVIEAETLMVIAGVDLYGQGKRVMEMMRRVEAADTTPVSDTDEFRASVEGRP